MRSSEVQQEGGVLGRRSTSWCHLRLWCWCRYCHRFPYPCTRTRAENFFQWHLVLFREELEQRLLPVVVLANDLVNIESIEDNIEIW